MARAGLPCKAQTSAQIITNCLGWMRHRAELFGLWEQSIIIPGNERLSSESSRKQATALTRRRPNQNWTPVATSGRPEGSVITHHARSRAHGPESERPALFRGFSSGMSRVGIKLWPPRRLYTNRAGRSSVKRVQAGNDLHGHTPQHGITTKSLWADAGASRRALCEGMVVAASWAFL